MNIICKKSVSLFGLLMVLIGSFFVRSAYALPIAVDTTHGMGTATRDTVSGLEWLDFSLTRTFSFDTLMPELEVGGLFYGYQLASRDQVGTFFSNTGSYIEGPTAYDVFQNLQGLLSGNANDASGNGLGLTFLGITSDRVKTSDGFDGHKMFGLLNDRSPAIPINFPDEGFGESYPDSSFVNNPPVYISNSHIEPSGFWLVKATSSTVPEPNIISLLIIGLVGSSVGRKVKKHKLLCG